MSSLTSTDLLDGITDNENVRAWAQFLGRYQPLLVAFGRKMGLQEQDALDAAQETLIAFVQGYRKNKYDRGKGRLRNWLYGIMTHKVKDLRGRERRQPFAQLQQSGTELLDQLPDESSMSEIWEEEWRRTVLKACIDEVRPQFEPSSIKAFELRFLQGLSGEEAALQLGISRAAVFKASSRVLAEVVKIRDRIERDW